MRFVLALLVGLVCFGCGRPASVSRTAISGRVTDDMGRPVAGAMVFFGDIGTVTGTDGRYELTIGTPKVPTVAVSIQDANGDPLQWQGYGEAQMYLPKGAVIKNFTVTAPAPARKPIRRALFYYTPGI